GRAASSPASSRFGPTRAAGTRTLRTRVLAPTASRRRCPGRRWRAPAATGSPTPAPRSAGACPIFKATTARRAAPGRTSRRTAGTKLQIAAAAKAARSVMSPPSRTGPLSALGSAEPGCGHEGLGRHGLEGAQHPLEDGKVLGVPVVAWCRRPEVDGVGLRAGRRWLDEQDVVRPGLGAP